MNTKALKPSAKHEKWRGKNFLILICVCMLKEQVFMTMQEIIYAKI
jgi:hypothetical protein